MLYTSQPAVGIAVVRLKVCEFLKRIEILVELRERNAFEVMLRVMLILS